MKNLLSEIKIDHNSYVSLHVQLHNQLRQLIVSGRWAYNERIPSELQLTKHLNISRTTVRIALQSAEIEGLITRVAGRGTFVTYEATAADESPRLIGYVTRSFHNDFHSILLSSVETELRSAGYRVIFSNATNIDQELSVLNELLEDNVAGLMIFPNAGSTDEQVTILQRYAEQQVPIIFVDRFVAGIEADLVTSDNYGGMYALTDHLIELGHKHIIHLTHNVPDLFPLTERQRGYEAAMNAHDLPTRVPWKVNSPGMDTFNETDIHELLDDVSDDLIAQVIAFMENTTRQPTALLCSNDVMAIIATRAMKRLGLAVPDEISVTGFDDIKLASYLATPLTTSAQNAHEIGRLAAQILLDRLDGNSGPVGRHTVPTRMQIRMSTSTPRSTYESMSNKKKE